MGYQHLPFYTWGYVEIKPLYTISIMHRIISNMITIATTKMQSYSN